MDRPVSPSISEATQARYEFTCWGEFALVDSTGRDLSPRGRKARGVLAWLAAHPDMPVSRERLAGLLWSDRGEDQARASLRQCLLELRHLSGGGSSLLRVARDHVTLNSASLAGNRGTSDPRVLASQIAAGEGILYRDLDDLSEGFDEWLRAERPRRRAQLVASALEAAEAGLARGDVAGARELMGVLAGLDPLDEIVTRTAMTADARAGDVAALERRYQCLQQSLASELRVEPSGETQSLHRDLLRQLGREAPPAEEDEPLPGAAIDPVAAALAAKPRWWRLVPALGAVLVVALLAAALTWLIPNPLRQANAEPATLAVLPFRNLAPGDDYFAEGVSEEILSQLSKQPGLRVAGRTSSALFKDKAVDVGEIGRRLDVDYVLEGAVRIVADRVRVDVALVRTEDGFRLWSQAFSGRLDDIFAIQQRVGSGVAGNLRAKFVGGGRLLSPLTTRGDVYSLYLTARGLLREREPAKTEAALDLLRSAVKLDPGFAPSWASLGVAVKLHWWDKNEANQPANRDPAAKKAAVAEATRHARRALELAPNLAEAHAALGMIRDFHPFTLPHLERALRLDPNNAEAWYWLYNVRLEASDFEGALQAIRRSVAIDPFWVRNGWFPELAWQMGYRDEALRYMRRMIEKHPDPFYRQWWRGEVAMLRNDWSVGARLKQAASRMAQPDARANSDLQAAVALVRMGLFDEASRLSPIPEKRLALMKGKVGSRQELVAHFPRPIDFWSSTEGGMEVQRLLLNAGRGADYLMFYDRAFSSPEAMVAQHPLTGVDFLSDAVSVAVALHDSGRSAEAERLLAIADRIVSQALKRGRVPSWFHAESARVWAAQGKREAALGALERAVAMGWQSYTSVAPRLAEEPAFRAIRDEPRLKRLDARIQGDLARERREFGQVAI